MSERVEPAASRRPARIFNSLTALYRVNEAQQKRKVVEALRKHRPVLREDVGFTKFAVDENAAADEDAAGEEPAADISITPGELRLQEFEELMENGYRYESKPLRRSPFQRDFCDVCVRALAANIVGPEDWPKVSQKVMRKHGWANVKKFAAASAPRRFGKSVMLCCMITNYAIFVPKSTQCVFSTGGRASTNDLEIIVQFLRELGLSHWIHRKNNEMIWLLPDKNKPDDIRKIYCYPSNEKISRREEWWWWLSCELPAVVQWKNDRFGDNGWFESSQRLFLR